VVEKLEDILTHFGEKVAAGEQNTAGQHSQTARLRHDGADK
jgi:hypothetical protein